jgi:hypothetical protein
MIHGLTIPGAIEVAQRPHGAFYDHVNAVLAGREAMRVTPASVRETMRVLEMIRKSAKPRELPLPGTPGRGQGRGASDATRL